MECGDYGATADVFVRTESAKEQEPENVIAQGRLMEAHHVLEMKWIKSIARPMNVVGIYPLSSLNVCNVVSKFQNFLTALFPRYIYFGRMCPGQTTNRTWTRL